MVITGNITLVTTNFENCKVCYTCVRECPAKAIKIADGQAEVIGERCIACGNCVRVCSQHAKQVYDSTGQVFSLLKSKNKVAACLAPSFPAEFDKLEYEKIVGMIRALGFDYVTEVAFGADLVARQYADLLKNRDGKRYIATTCPAIVGYVERYHPKLVDALAPIVSPMMAQARSLHKMHGDDLKIVFIGPCIAKKGEAMSAEMNEEVDAVITFTELHEMLNSRDITPDNCDPGQFDEPLGGTGGLFPISRGMLQAADIPEDLIAGKVVAAEGKSEFTEAIKEFEAGDLDAKLLEVLCCDGCIMGSGMSTCAPQFSRRSKVSQYVRAKMRNMDQDTWNSNIKRFEELDLSRIYWPNDQRIPVPSKNEIDKIMTDIGKFSIEDELNCGACGYDTCREHALAIYKGLAENEMCLPHTIDQLKQSIKDLAVSNEQLESTQEALMQSEKLASMGQLAAGIAHEVNNPLGVVLMYSHMLQDECETNSQMSEDLSMIAEQADRCKKIVSGLLHFARQNKVVLENHNICKVIANCLKTIQIPNNVKVETVHQNADQYAEIDKDQILQVLTNLFNNAIGAMPEGGTLTIKTEEADSVLSISINDSGVGIPERNLNKIFEPFFTTKQIGIGTGLGLAVTYGIVKMHRGDIKVQSNTDPAAGPTGTIFTVTLPVKG